MKQNDFVFFMRSVICNFENNKNHGTAHIYKNSLNSFITFCHSSTIPFRKITPELLKGFEAYLRQKQRSWNTVSTYLRALRATYNRAVCPCSCINLLEQAWNVGSQMLIDSTVVGGTQCT